MVMERPEPWFPAGIGELDQHDLPRSIRNGYPRGRCYGGYNHWMKKRFLGAGELLADSFRLAARIYDSGFRPNLLLGVWRGGAPVGIAVQEYFARRGVRCAHLPVKTASYAGPDRRQPEVVITGLEIVLNNLRPDSIVLIVDDVFDTGLSLKELLRQLREATPDSALQIRLACPWYKPRRNLSGLVPDYYLYETDDWLVFPHELLGLDATELRRKPDLGGVADDITWD